MSADSYFAIGSTHQVCQDHAISDGDFVVLSDGCSGAKDSDWGARFITRAAYNILKQTKPDATNKFIANVIEGAKSYSDKVDLHPDCLCATLLCAYVKDGQIHTFIVGDGYIIARSKDGTKMTVLSHVYETGAPWYPYYSLNDELKEGYAAHFGHGRLTVETTLFEKGVVTSRNEAYYPSLGLAFSAVSWDAEYDLVGISSDGLKSFAQQVKGGTSITNKPVKEEQVIKDLFAFKTVEGQFVHRRCQKFLRDYATQNIKHTDDFSLGVLHVQG